MIPTTINCRNGIQLHIWLNSFPRKDSVHPTISPRAIMTGKRIMYDKHCKVEFGTYVQKHEKHNNSMEPRTSGAIALRPSGNEQGRHYFLSLHTGKKILRNHWTILPMPNDVVDAVHRLAAASKQAGGITLTDKDGNIITDDDDEEIEEAMENDEPIPVPDDYHENIINDNRELQEWMKKWMQMTSHQQYQTIKMRQLQEWTINRTWKTHTTTHLSLIHI